MIFTWRSQMFLYNTYLDSHWWHSQFVHGSFPVTSFKFIYIQCLEKRKIYFILSMFSSHFFLGTVIFLGIFPFNSKGKGRVSRNRSSKLSVVVSISISLAFGPDSTVKFLLWDTILLLLMHKQVCFIFPA